MQHQKQLLSSSMILMGLPCGCLGVLAMELSTLVLAVGEQTVTWKPCTLRDGLCTAVVKSPESAACACRLDRCGQHSRYAQGTTLHVLARRGACCAGMLACWNHPFEVARIEAQARGDQNQKDLNMVQIFRMIVKEQVSACGLCRALICACAW